MKCKYSVRYFSSKGAYLVLLWTLLITISGYSLYSSTNNISPVPWRPAKWWILAPIAVALISAPLLGWLADAKFGNYKVFKFGAVLLFVSTVMNCLMLILELVVWDRNHVLNWIHYLCIDSSLFVVGACACLVTALPLGLDQMPDASSSSIASYIAWFVSTFLVALFLGRGAQQIIKKCTDERMQLNYQLIWALTLSICMSVVVSSIFVFSPKWLIIEPKSPQSLKTIYQVLKFAAKHKSPLNRSAFTYWEENIPSRIDLGKMKYGGPFTTEQVEDVKTILHLLAFAISLLFGNFAFFFTVYFHDESFHPTTICKSNVFYLMRSVFEYCFLWTFVHEFFVYPLFRNKLPSILKRIGASFWIITFVCFSCCVLKLAQFLSNSDAVITGWIVSVLYYSATGILGQVLVTSGFEFMCAQSPYNMRGLLLSSVVPLLLIPTGLGSIVGQFFMHETCLKLTWCALLLFSVKTVLCLIGSLLVCVVARWYKMRVRDDEYSTQQVVEEVYDRYLTAAAAQARSYGTVND